MRIEKKFYVKDIEAFRAQAIRFAGKDTHCCYINGNRISYEYDSFPETLAFGCKEEFLSEVIPVALPENKWLFGYFSYFSSELEVKQEELFPKHLFFIPITVILFQPGNIVHIESEKDPSLIFKTISEYELREENEIIKASFKPLISKETYIRNVNELIQNIRRGNIYQANYCIRYEASDISVNLPTLYQKLNDASPMPFSGFFKGGNFGIISASPERFLKKSGSKIISQPMKGTASRHAVKSRDEQNRNYLLSSEKERAENIMIVDLVRNDLARICKDATVKAESVCSLYSFKTIHQLVSTVTGTLSSVSFGDIMDKVFPMGSMTGAPKLSAMELIDKLEPFARGPFSGSLGYFDPEGSFDLNVLIRSVFINLKEKKAFFCAGSGITYLSDPEKEYEECLLKANLMQKLFMDDV